MYEAIECIEIELLTKASGDGKNSLVIPVKISIPLMTKLPDIINFRQKYFIQNAKGQFEEAYMFIASDRT